MRKFLLILATITAINTSAGNFITSSIRPITRKAEMHPEHFIPGPTGKVNKISPKSTAMITEQPAGELKTYNRSGGSFFFNGYLVTGEQEGKAYIVWGENGKVYLKDPVYGLKCNTWVEGTLCEDGKKISVPLGQTVTEEDGQTLDLCWMSTYYEYPEDGDGGTVTIKYTVDENVTEAIYTIDGDNIILEGTSGNIDAPFPESGVMTGLSAVWSDTKLWNGCVDYGTVYELSTIVSLKVITDQPEGELVEYKRAGECLANGMFGMSFDSQDGKAYVVFGSDDKVYLQDPISGIKYGSWVEGTLSEDGKTITVPMGQCLFWDIDYDYGLIIKDVTLSINEFGEMIPTINENTTMTYSIEGNTITLNDTYGDKNTMFMTEMRGLCGIWTNDMSFSGNLDWKTVYTKHVLAPAVPADPIITPPDIPVAEVWEDGNNEFGSSKFWHIIKLEDVDGNPIDADHVTYSIFTDDDSLFTFDAFTYISDLYEDATEIPYTLNGYDISPRRTVFYRTNADGYERFFDHRIGIQVYYTVNGVKNASNIVYYNLPTFAENGTPTNPTVNEWERVDSEWSELHYTISEYTTNGDRMDPNRMYFSFYTDNDQLFTFTTSQYRLNEDMTLVPYNFKNAFITKKFSQFKTIEPFFNHQIGIQVHYMQENGNMASSDIVYLEVFPKTGISDVKANSATDVTLYSIDGRSISTPQAGVNIIKMSDGSVKKVLVK